MSKQIRAIFRLDEDLYPNTVTGKNETGVELENGAFVEIGVLKDNELGRDTYSLAKLTGEANKQIGFVSSPALMYDERQDERDFVCAVDELVRVYKPNTSTIGTFALKHFDGAESLVAGDLLVPKATTNQLTKLTVEETAFAQVVAKEDFEGQESLVIRFL